MKSIKEKWVDSAIFYQVYPTSFYDSDGDGIGDLNGITEKLWYIEELGVNALWINPFFKSPFKDGGYDVEDYCAVDERFGTMNDFENLVCECKKRGIKVLIDLVIGHTSDKHKWFIESSKDERNEFSDYYIWTDNIFNKYEDKTIHGLYDRNGGYYINYYACQPALNFGFNEYGKSGLSEKNDYDLGDGWKMHYTDERLKPLREEILRIMRFWLDKGVDGFRVDMANSLVKGCVYDSDNDKDTEGLVWLWNKLIPPIKKDYPDAVFLAEWCYPQNAVGKCGFDLDYFGHDNEFYNELFRNEKGTNLLPTFERGHNYFSEEGKGSAKNFINHTLMLTELLAGKGGFSAPTGCHDSIRLATGKSDCILKTVFAFLLTYKHIPMIYYGDEIGLTHDFSVNKDGGFIRTGARTPMQWDDSKNRGFSCAEEIYLPVNDKESQCVNNQEQNGNSLLSTVKKLIELRKKYSCLNYSSDIKITECDEGYPLIYERSDGKTSLRIIINPSDKLIIREIKGKVIISENSEICDNKIRLSGPGFAVVEL